MPPDMLTSADRAIELAGLSVQFKSRRESVTAVDGVDLTVRRNGFLSVIGPSGCGKSTLLRVIAGLIPPSSGTAAILGGTTVSALRSHAIGFVFQDPALMPWRTAVRNVQLPLEVVKSAPGAADPMELLALVGLAGREHAYPHQLSGGQCQRVAIARALVTRPQILLMDEPFGALDEITRDALNAELLNLWHSVDTTVVFVTHSIAEAVFLSERVAVMSSGPGRVTAAVDVPLPYPRDLSIKDRPEFTAITAQLREHLRGRQ